MRSGDNAGQIRIIITTTTTTTTIAPIGRWGMQSGEERVHDREVEL